MFRTAHPLRVEVLHALAMLTAGNRSLPEGLEALAEGDPGLRPWAARIARALRSGALLGEALKSAGVITRRECLFLLDRPHQQTQALRDLAAGTIDAAPGYWLVRWLPVWLMAIATIPGTVVLAIITRYGIAAEVIRELGISTETFSWPQLLLQSVGMITAVWVGMLILPYLFIGSLVLRSWMPEVHRRALIARLLHRATAGEGGGDGPETGSPKAWKRDWKRWSNMTMLRLPRTELRHLRTLSTLKERCLAVGWVPTGADGRPDWRAALLDARAAYCAAYDRESPRMYTALWVVGLAGFFSLVMRPLTNLIDELGSVGMGLPGPHSVLPLLCFITGGALAGIVVWQAALALRALPLWDRPKPELGLLVLGRLAATMQGGGDAGKTLLALRSLVPMPYGDRLARAAQAIAAGQQPIPALAHHLLIPRSWIPAANAAAALGPEAFARWVAELGDRDPAPRGRMPALAMLPLAGMLMVFFMVGIMPKFEQIFHELGLPFTPDMGLLIAIARFIAAWWWAAVLLFLILASFLPDLINALWNRPVQRRARAVLILAGIHQGRSEAAIAETLVHSGIPVAAGHAAGATGDFPALCRACGWIAATPEALAATLLAAKIRAARWRAWGRLIWQCSFPILFGIPVGWVVLTVYGMLLSIVATLAEHGS